MKSKDIFRRAMNYVSVFGRASNHFGVCPVCYESDGYLNIGRNHLFVCHHHKVSWNVGSNLFSSWREENEVDWKRNAELLADYKEVEGNHPGLWLIRPRYNLKLRSIRYKIFGDNIPF